MKSKVISVVFALGALFILGNFDLLKEKEPAPVFGTSFYFPASLLNEMMGRSSCTHIRFYSAENPMLGESVMAVSVASGADMPIEGAEYTKYQLYEGAGGSSSIVEPTDLETARTIVSNGTNAFAADIPNQQISNLLSVEGTAGIILTKISLSNGESSFTATSGHIVEGQLINVENANTYKVSSPCPSSCGSDPADNYLVDLSR